MLFAGDDWAEDHHDVELQDERGRVLARARLPEGLVGITRLHALIGQFVGPDAEPGEVAVGIETDRGPVGDGAARGRLYRLFDQPAAGGPVPGTARHVGGQKR